MTGVKVKVTGTEELNRVALALASASDGQQLRRDLGRNIRAATRPAVAGVRASLQAGLPKRGGLADYFAKSTIGTRTRLAGKSAGVRIVVQKKGHSVTGVDEGLIRHPLFGNRKHWFTQTVQPNLITGPLDASKPDVQRGVIAAMDSVADRIARSS